MSVRRRTFILQIREPDRVPMLENVRTKERVLLGSLAEVAGQVDRWLEADGGAQPEISAAGGATVVGTPAPVSVPLEEPDLLGAAGETAEPRPRGHLVALADPRAEAEPVPALAPLEGDEPEPQLRRFSRPSGAD